MTTQPFLGSECSQACSQSTTTTKAWKGVQNQLSPAFRIHSDLCTSSYCQNSPRASRPAKNYVVLLSLVLLVGAS